MASRGNGWFPGELNGILEENLGGLLNVTKNDKLLLEEINGFWGKEMGSSRKTKGRNATNNRLEEAN